MTYCGIEWDKRISLRADTYIVEENRPRARSFGTIPFTPIPEYTVIVLFWELFLFRNERSAIPFILLPIAEWSGWYFGGKIARPRRSLLITSAILFSE